MHVPTRARTLARVWISLFAGADTHTDFISSRVQTRGFHLCSRVQTHIRVPSVHGCRHTYGFHLFTGALIQLRQPVGSAVTEALL